MKSKTMKFLIGLIGVVVLYQGAKWGWGETAQAYFNYRCEQDAGEFIYRTVEDVEGVFQMRPREQGEYFSRLRRGDLMEDPYGHTNTEAQRPWTLFLRHPSKPTYHFFETSQAPDLQEYDLGVSTREFSKRPEPAGQPYWRMTYDGLRRRVKSDLYWTMLRPEQVSEIKSQYGFTWRQVRNRWDKYFGIIGGELIIKKLDTDETLGIRRGFFFWPSWSKRGGICPKRKHDYITVEFVSKVLKPAPFDDSFLKEKEYGY